MKQNYTKEWLEVSIKGYKFFLNNFYYEMARTRKREILATTKMTEQEFEELVKA